MGGGNNGLEDVRGNDVGTWVVPSIVGGVKDFKDSSSSICNVLLIDVIKGQPGSNGDLEEVGGGNNGRFGSGERHLILS